MTRLVGVELRKMFDTRSGFWLMTSIGITALLATGAVILFAPDSELTYNNFAAAIGVPMTIILPIMAILSVTSEWSQRNGLTTFTLVPHRGRVIWAKAISAVGVGVVSIIVAFSIGALGNVVGTTITGTDLVWDLTWENLLYITFANVLGLLMGFMLGVLIRNSAGAIVGYFVYSLVLPTIFGMLASFQEWFRDIQGWVDFQFSSTQLFDGALSSERVGPPGGLRPHLADPPDDRRRLAGAPLRDQVAPATASQKCTPEPPSRRRSAVPLHSGTARRCFVGSVARSASGVALWSRSDRLAAAPGGQEAAEGSAEVCLPGDSRRRWAGRPRACRRTAGRSRRR